VILLPESDVLPPAAPPRERARRLARRWWWVALLVVALGVVGVVNQRDGTTSIPLHPSNPDPGGTMALTRILEQRGVEVILVSSVPDAVAATTPDATLLVADLRLLTEDHLRELATVRGDIVIAGNPYARLAPLTEAVTAATAGTATPVAAACSDPDAVAAGTVSSSVGSVAATRDGVEVCFPTAPGTGAFAVWSEDGRTWRYLAEPGLMTNRLLAEEGTAALTLRALGHHPRLVWFLPTEAGLARGDAAPSPVPPVVPALAIIGAGVVLALAVRGRHMGPVVLEPLPVVVRPGETVHGRARLYRRSRAVGHAAAALRAGTARRLAARLGLGRTADMATLVAAVSAATGRDPRTIEHLLAGEPPASEAALVELATALTLLESEARP